MMAVSKMESKNKINQFLESIITFFNGGDQLPWCSPDVIVGCEKEVADATKGSSDEVKNESIMRLSWALVHSKRPEDVQRGIAMLEVSLANSSSPLQKREKFYLLAVGYYRIGEYSKSRELTGHCLEIAPDWRQALLLQKATENRITKDGVIGIGITATILGLIAGGIAASLVRRN